MSRDEKIVKVLKRVLPIMSILTLFVFVMLINKKSYALFHKRIETDITIHISTADKMPGVSDKVLAKAKEKSCNPTIEDEDGTIYFSGDNNCIDFNYVWYSGKLWRITAINPDGTMKMITQDAITSIYWNANNETYANSWIYQWLNEDFKDTLYNYQNIVVQNADWNATTNGNSTPVKPPTDVSATIVQGDVGSLNAYEYYQSYKNLGSYSNGYLNIGYYWWLITPNTGSHVRHVDYLGSLDYYHGSPSSDAFGVRPSINLKSNIELKGEGTKSNPYTIVGDKATGTPGEAINTRLSGEYVSVDDKVYRIVGIEDDNTTKLTSADYVRDDSGEVLMKNFGSNANWGTSVKNDSDDNYWSYYLNNTWVKTVIPNYEDILEKGTYYLGLVAGVSYKNSICSTSNTNETTKNCEKTSSKWEGLVGLPRIGEMFSAQLGEGNSTSTPIWLITTNSNSTSPVWDVETGGEVASFFFTFTKCGIRPSINLKSGVKIAGGSGTEDDPYTVSIS